MEVATIMHDMLSILSYQYLFLADIKYQYWAVNMHLDNHHYLAFYVSEIGAIQQTCMAQGAGTLFFTFGELLNIVLGLILLSQPKLLLLYRKTAKDTVLIAFYINNIFKAFKTY